MLQFIRRYPQLLLFGTLTAVFSSPGQTFLVSLFIPHMRETFGMSQTHIAAVYSLATLLSAMVLPWTGRILDRIHLLKFCLGAGLLLAAGCFLLAGSRNLVALLAGFFLIRNLGQGTLTMVSATTMARVFGPMRGKALGISNLGYPVGEAFFPMMVSSWILAFGWRSGWLFLAGLIMLIFIPGIYFLLKQDPHKKAQREIEKELERAEKKMNLLDSGRDWTLQTILRDKRFYQLLFPLLLTPFYFTAFFFHQVAFVEAKGWSVQWIASGFVAFGACRALASFMIGPWIDRLSARRIFPFNLLPLALGLIGFWFGEAPIWSFIYLGLAGMTMGYSMTITSALLAEFYGVERLGSIKGFLGSVIVFSTALAPMLFGVLLDSRVPLPWIFGGTLIFLLFGTLSAWRACRVSA